MRFAVCLYLCSAGLWATETAKVVFDRAAQALVAGDYEAAEQGFKSVLREQPRHLGALGNLGIVYSRTNRADLAISTYERALKLDPNDEPILLNLGLVYLRQEAHEKALQYFDRVLAANSRNRQARQLGAVCRLYTGRLPLAIEQLKSLQSENPRDEQVLFLLGFAYLKNREPERAKQVFAEMFEVAGPARTQFLLGKASYEAELYDAAEQSFQDVIRADPNFPGVHLELGKLYMRQHRSDDAKREFSLVLRNESNNEDAYFFLGSLLVEENKVNEAVPYLDRALRLRPDSGAVLLYLGRAKLRLGEPAEAVPLLQRAVALIPDEPSAYFQLGKALTACGRKAEAEAVYDKAQHLTTATAPAAKPSE